MNLALDINDFDINGVFFQKPITNTVIDNSEFIRILYSTELMILNGIYIKIKLNIKSVESYYNKYKCVFTTSDNYHIISKIQSMENLILDRYCSNKNKKKKIYEQLNNCYVKIFTDNAINPNNMPEHFTLKISGIWETNNDCGITYKFITINHQ
jgi:hypothetical protein